MATISAGLIKRGHRKLYEGDYASAVECFSRANLAEPQNFDNILDLIYALNQAADYNTALTYCYALLGMEDQKIKRDTLYFLTAEAFGGAGCIDGCAQMLMRSLKENPNGAYSQDASNFLNDLKKKYSIGKIDDKTNVVTLGLPNSITDAPFLNYESMRCMKEVSHLVAEGKIDSAIKCVEKELDTGNVTVSLLGVAIMLAGEKQDKKYAQRCAERFKFVEDYTTSEIHALAYNLTHLNDDDIAYTVFKELYFKESGDKDIAFGFAVACERIGEIAHAREIIKGVVSACGGRGPAVYYQNIIGNRTHSYMLKYEDDTEQAVLSRIYNNELGDNFTLAETIDFLRFAQIDVTKEFLSKADNDSFLFELELRRLAINPSASLFTRVQAAAKVFKEKQPVYLNTGSDIVEFTPEIEKVINNFFERGMTNEATD
ncbi:MAG: hypothetical protein IKB86_00805 [Clostridia bacterium]|nr:hypothetical protein [Clostridia bacterium]